MNKLIFLFVAGFIAFAGSAFAQTPAAKVTEIPKTVDFEKAVIDFGEIPQNVPATATFNFKNITKAPVVLKNVQASCGCTAPEWTKEPVLPKKSGFVKATYNAAAPGAFTKTVTVTLDKGEQAILTIKGTVVTDKK